VWEQSLMRAQLEVIAGVGKQAGMAAQSACDN
jgi:hypothetical protein